MMIRDQYRPIYRECIMRDSLFVSSFITPGLTDPREFIYLSDGRFKISKALSAKLILQCIQLEKI